MTDELSDSELQALLPEPIFAERKRQIEQEGWTADHDDQHDDGGMMRAAMIYFLHATSPESIGPTRISPQRVVRYGGIGHPVERVTRSAVYLPQGWPWAAEWWKPKTPRRDLERAGALMLAERDRLRRRGQPVVHVDYKLRSVAKAYAALGDGASTDGAPTDDAGSQASEGLAARHHRGEPR